jgi:putative transposase
VNALCQMTGVSRAGYYRWRVPPPRFPVEMELRDAMQQIALEYPCYGYRRITVELNRRGFAINHKRVLRLMREDNLLCLRRKAFVVTTNSRHNLPVYQPLSSSRTVGAFHETLRADSIRMEGRQPSLFLRGAKPGRCMVHG